MSEKEVRREVPMNKTVEAINCLANYCALKNLSTLTSAQIQAKIGQKQVDLFVLFGGSILAGGDLLAQAIQDNLAKKYVIVGGHGHTTEALKEQMQPWLSQNEQVMTFSEAELFQLYLKNRYQVAADYLETKSTNCGNNITFLLRLIQKNKLKAESILLMQDATMQRRMAAVMQKECDFPTRILNFPAYEAQVKMDDFGHLTYTSAIPGMWSMARFIELLMGKIPRLHDTPTGYGPLGKNYLAHVDVPLEVRQAFATLEERFPQAVRQANPQFHSDHVQ